MAGVGRVASISTGGGRDNYLIIVTERGYLLGVGMTAVAGVSLDTLFLAGWLSGNNAFVVAVTESGYPSLNVGITAVAGVRGISPLLTGWGGDYLLVRMSQRIGGHRYS